MLEQEESKFGLSELHNLLKDNNYDVPDSLDDFKSDMKDENNLNSVHKTLTKDNHKIPDLKTLKANFDSGKKTLEDVTVTANRSKNKIPSLEELMSKTKMPPKSEVQPGGAEMIKKDVEALKYTEEKRSNAIANQIKRQQKKYGNLSPQNVKSANDMYRNMLKSGNLMVTKDEKTGEDILAYSDNNLFTSILDTYNKSNKKKLEDNYFEGLSEADKVQYKKSKQEMDASDDIIKSKPSGFFGKSGEAIGDFISMIEKPTLFSIAAASGGEIVAAAEGLGGAVASGISGLKNVGNTLGFMSDMANNSYQKVWDEVYNGNLKGVQEPTREQEINAASKASKAANEAKSVGALTGAVFGIPTAELSGLEESVNGYMETLMASGKHTLKELPKFAGVTAAGSIAEGDIAKEYGSGKTQSQIISGAAEEAAQSLSFPIGMFGLNAIGSAVPHALTLLANRKIDPSFKSPAPALTAIAKNIVNKIPRNIVQDAYHQAENNGILPKGTGDAVLKDVDNYNKVLSKVPKTVTDENVKTSLAGKLEKKDKLTQESKDTPIPARKIEIEKEISQLDKEIDNIYNGGDVLENEHDIANNPLKQTEVDLPEVTVEGKRKKPEQVSAQEEEGAALKSLREYYKSTGKTDEEIEKELAPIKEGIRKEREDRLAKEKEIADKKASEEKRIADEAEAKRKEVEEKEKSKQQRLKEKREADKIRDENKLVKSEDISNYEKLPGYDKYGTLDKVVTLDDMGIDSSNTKNAKEFAEKLAAVDGPLKPLLTAISRMPKLEKVKFFVNKKGDLIRTEELKGASGLYRRNPLWIPNELTMADLDTMNMYQIGAHELMHWVTLSSDFVDKNNKDYKTLNELYRFYINKHPKYEYGLTNFNEFMAEMLVNNDFRRSLEKTVVENKEDFKKITGEFKSFLDHFQPSLIETIYNWVRDLVNKLLNKHGENIDFDKSLVENSVDLMIKSFIDRDEYNIIKPEDRKYTKTEEGKAIDKEAKDLGFDNVTHAINSVNQALGTDYKTFQEIKPEDLKETIDIRNHNKAFEQTVKGTEYEKQAGDIKPSGEATTGTTGEVSGQPESAESATYEDAGFRSEQEARDAYESDTERDPNETYEEWKFIKHCGEI